jgi:CheY-like chemotaxis protein
MQRDSSLSNSSKKHLDAINLSGEHLLALINDVLEVSKIESGCLSLTEDVFDLHSMIEELDSMFRMRAEQKRLLFKIEKQDLLPHLLTGDVRKLRQVLINIIGNAIKFTDTGSVTLRVFAESDFSLSAEHIDKCQWTLFFEVEDTGIGIMPQEMDKLFQPFEQTMSGKSKGGTGLGLTISREYMCLMGGDLVAGSVFGKGSLFTASCRFKEGQQEFGERQEEVRRVLGLAPDVGSRTILVVDDKEKSRRYVVELLTFVGFKILEAANGEEALAVCRKKKPDLVLMDMRLPLMDGYEATRRLKATAKGKKIPVIAVSASAFEEERNEILASGADEFISKPFKESELFAGIKKLLGIEFRYAEDTAVLPGQSELVTLTPSDLARLPDDLREELRQALIILHVGAIQDVIGRIYAFDKPLGRFLKRMEKQYQFEILLDLLK